MRTIYLEDNCTPIPEEVMGLSYLDVRLRLCAAQSAAHMFSEPMRLQMCEMRPANDMRVFASGTTVFRMRRRF